MRYLQKVFTSVIHRNIHFRLRKVMGRRKTAPREYLNNNMFQITINKKEYQDGATILTGKQERI